MWAGITVIGGPEVETGMGRGKQKEGEETSDRRAVETLATVIRCGPGSGN